MRRVHLPELEDQPWFPATIRAAMTGSLRTFAEATGFARRIAEHLAPAVRASGARALVDLCAGSGGPTVAVLRALRAEGVDVEVTLTDLYPNLRAFAAIEAETGGAIKGWPTPVDATAVPPELPGFRLLFNAFHHLPEPVAQGVLRDAMEAGQPIAIYEIVSRDPGMMLGMMGAPLGVLGIVPTLRPFDWRWIPLTYVVPLVPLASGWDAMVSCLRIYEPAELAALVAPLRRPGWRWEIGRFPLRPFRFQATFLRGAPA